MICLKINLCFGFIFSGHSPPCKGRGDALEVPPVWEREGRLAGSAAPWS